MIEVQDKRRAIEVATSNGCDSPIGLSPKRFTISDDDTLKRLAGLK